MVSAPQSSRSLPRWLIYAGLWLLFTCVFSSQIFLAGYVTPWSRAFVTEGIYWLSWAVIAPALFWWCRRLRTVGWRLRTPALLLGALIAMFVAPLISEALFLLQATLHLCIGDCDPNASAFAAVWLRQVVRIAGVNLPVYAGLVLAWHAATFYREARDRQMQAVELESLLQKAQLETLRGQLNPHFLFNALHSMAELVHADPKLAERLIVRLGELLRQVLESSARPEVSLREELDFIRGYVDIEQMRLGERLRVEWDIEPAALEVRVPSLILQPLVENAIQHGIAATAGPGTLTLRAQRADGFLRLEVRDNGPGLASAAPGRPQGIGLANTRARLQRLYGDKQSFELRVNDGLTVSLRIPLATA